MPYFNERTTYESKDRERYIRYAKIGFLVLFIIGLLLVVFGAFLVVDDDIVPFFVVGIKMLVWGSIIFLSSFGMLAYWIFERRQQQKREKSDKKTVQTVVAETQKSAGQRFCPDCGHKLTPGMEFCPGCGKDLRNL